MRKALPVPAIVVSLAVVLLIVVGVLGLPLLQPPGPDATNYRRQTPEEIAREHTTPPAGMGTTPQARPQ